MNISSTPTRDKRRRPVDKDGPRSKRSKKQVDSTSSSSAGSIQICDVDVDGRYVQIKNMSDKVIVVVVAVIIVIIVVIVVIIVVIIIVIDGTSWRIQDCV